MKKKYLILTFSLVIMASQLFAQKSSVPSATESKRQLDKIKMCLGGGKEKILTPDGCIGLHEVKIFGETPKKVEKCDHAIGICENDMVVLAGFFYSRGFRYPQHEQLINALRRDCHQNGSRLHASFIPL